MSSKGDCGKDVMRLILNGVTGTNRLAKLRYTVNYGGVTYYLSFFFFIVSPKIIILMQII